MNKKLILFLSMMAFVCILKPGGYIYNMTNSKIYYGNENSTWLSSINPKSYCGVKNYYIIYPQNSANGPALWIDFIPYVAKKYKNGYEEIKVKTETYKCYMINGSIYAKEKNPTVNTAYTTYRGFCTSEDEGFKCTYEDAYMKASIYDNPEYPGTFFVKSN